jgi:hypothetical protein
MVDKHGPYWLAAIIPRPSSSSTGAAVNTVVIYQLPDIRAPGPRANWR